MLGVLEILQTRNILLGKYKIHLATSLRRSPLDLFFEGRFKEWQEEQNALNFQCENILSLIGLENGLWLFAGVYKVLGVDKGKLSPYLYKTELLPNQEDLIGRVVVNYKRTFRASYIWGHKWGHLLEVAEIKPQKMRVREFPGYNRIIVSYRELRLLVAHQESTWKSALENVQGVYLIGDKSNGKFYVGSAYGGEGIWHRWECYVLTGHGDNVELIALFTDKGLQHAENFQYSVLEIADLHATPEFIIERENYWKEALLSRQYGYNAN